MRQLRGNPTLAAALMEMVIDRLGAAGLLPSGRSTYASRDPSRMHQVVKAAKAAEMAQATE